MENPPHGRGQGCGPNPPLPCEIQTQIQAPPPNQQVTRPARVEEIGQMANRINNLERGSRGQRNESISNYFPITSYTNWTLYKYRVDFNPVQERTNIQRGLLNTHNKFLGTYIFDGTMLFSRKKFESDTTELISKRNTDNQTVTITLNFTSVIKMDDYASIQVFNLLMRKGHGHLNFTLVERNNYDAEAKITIPNHKFQLCPNYDTTIGLFDGARLLRSEIKFMREDTVLDFLIEWSKTRNVNPNWMDTRLCTNIGVYLQKNNFGQNIKVSTENINLILKSFKRKISDLLQNNTSIQIKPKVRKYNELSTLASNESTIESLTDMMILRFGPKLFNRQITNATQYNTSIEITESSTSKSHKSYNSASIDEITNNISNKINSRSIDANNPASSKVVSSDVQILVVDEKSEISLIDPEEYKLKEWENPKYMTDLSTGQTVLLPFAIKQISKDKTK